MASKSVLIKLILLGGGTTTALATGSYFLASNLNKKGATSQKVEEELEEDKKVEWDSIFRWEGGTKYAVCQTKYKGESENTMQSDPNQACKTLWSKKWEKEITDKGGLKLKVGKKLVNEILGKLNGKELSSKLKDILGWSGANVKSQIENQKECIKEENGELAIFTCK